MAVTSKFNKFLAIDCETSSMSKSGDDPSAGCQMVSIGLIVSDTKTYKEIATKYIEIKWNGESEWNGYAERIHGLTRDYLDENGISEEDAAVEIMEFIMEHFDINKGIVIMGHNAASFDKYFFRGLLRKFGFELKISHRTIDTFSLGLVVLDAYDSDELFKQFNIPHRAEHNALDDIKFTLTACRGIRNLAKRLLSDG